MSTRLTAAQFLARRKGPSRAKRGNKYGAVKTVVDGRTFDSKKEAMRYADLTMMQRAGLISDLELQVSIPLQGRDGPLVSDSGRRLRYVADFTYRETDTGHFVVEDVKGHRTKTYLLKRSILAAQGIEVVET